MSDLELKTKEKFSNISLSDYVYEELLHQIKLNKFREGVRLPSENALAAEFRVSRPVVRSALDRLRKNGYIKSKKGSGSFLERLNDSTLDVPISVKTFEQLLLCYDYRTHLEGIIAYQAAVHATEYEKLHIENTYRKDCSKFSMGNEELMESDFAFHLVIAKATHNPFYYQALVLLARQLTNSFEVMSAETSRQTSSSFIKAKDEEHAAIVYAIQTGNPEYAQAEMQRHLFASTERLKSLFSGLNVPQAKEP